MKKILIVFKTRHGCTEYVANMLETRLEGDITLWNLSQKDYPDLSDYDTVIVGGSIHAGRIQDRVKRFMERHWEVIRTKKLGLFLCCMEKDEKARKQLEDAFLPEYRDHAVFAGILGGGFNFERMNFIEKFITKKVAGVKESSFNFDEETIQQFVNTINR